MVTTFTQDTLLDGRIAIRQQSEGYRVAIDPVLLAASVPPGLRVLDVGTGVGATALCYAWRVSNAQVTGLELQRAAVELARGNAVLNGLKNRIEIIAGDLLIPPSDLSPGGFDQVMANPPYLPARRSDSRICSEKSVSNVEGEAKLADWIEFCLRMAAPQGAITLIHRADRLDEIMALLHGRVGGIVVYPLWPKPEVSPKRILVRGHLNSRSPLRISPGIVLHRADGEFTEIAAEILLNGAALDL